MVNFYTEPLLRIIQYNGLSLGISKSGNPTYYYYSVRAGTAWEKNSGGENLLPWPHMAKRYNK
jgi:hypothetical protein